MTVDVRPSPACRRCGSAAVYHEHDLDAGPYRACLHCSHVEWLTVTPIRVEPPLPPLAPVRPARRGPVPRARCQVETCDRPHSANGYCDVHDQRVKLGLPLDYDHVARVERRCVVCGTTFQATVRALMCSGRCRHRAMRAKARAQHDERASA